MPQMILQGVGWGQGTPAQEIKPGDKLMWNYGYISEVLAISPRGKTQLTFSLRSENGAVHDRVMGRTRLVARCRT
jgi:hypothetical protein